MNKNNLPIYFSLAVVFGILIGSFFGEGSGMISTSKNEAKIKHLLDYIEKDYVDSVNTDKLLDGAIAEMLEKLDPHSVYIPKENLQAVQENMQGEFVGIGVQFRMINDSITVIQTLAKGPSEKAGIKAGDRILIANNDTLYGKSIFSNEIPKYLKGKPNSKIKLHIYRKTNDSLFTINITRGNVNIKSVDIAYMLTKKIGYIKLDRFARNTYKEFKKAEKQLLDEGMQTLVLDLRGNGGGFIDMATQIVDEFLEEGKMIVYTKNNKDYVEEFFSTNKGEFENGDLYILIDENSASASEIVAGAVQDNDRGTILGRRSFGKGLVQVEMDLGDGSAVRLTTARYYTPTGRSIQKPYSKKNIDSYQRDYLNRLRNGELINKDSIKVNDSLQYKTPKGKIVYGGGGIIPDVFVAIDTTTYLNNFYYRTINNFSFDYVDSTRDKLTKKWNLESFITDFKLEDNLLEEYYKSIKEYQNRRPPYKDELQIKEYLKASIANDLFGDNGFYRVFHKKDIMLQKVLELESTKE